MRNSESVRKLRFSEQTDETTGEQIRVNTIMMDEDGHDGETVLMSRLDDSFEHHILLANFGISQNDIDKYFRVCRGAGIQQLHIQH